MHLLSAEQAADKIEITTRMVLRTEQLTTFLPAILIGLAITCFSCNSRTENGPWQAIIDGYCFYFKEVQQSDFKSSDIHQLFLRGENAVRRGDFSRAKDFFERALEKDTNNGIVLNCIGLTESHLGNHQNSIEHLRKAIKTITDTLSFDYHINLSLALIMKGEFEQIMNSDSAQIILDFEQAIMIANKVIANSKDTVVISAAYYHRSIAETRLREYESALKDIRMAIELCDIDIFLSRMKTFEDEIEQMRNQEEELKAIFGQEQAK